MATTTTHESPGERTEKGVSLARGPALALGTVLLTAGLYFLYKQHGFPQFHNFPDGDAPFGHNVFFGTFRVNGWTGMLTAVAGGLLLFGAAQHLLAKALSLIVGVALGTAAIIGLAGHNVLGMAAANGWTDLGWGACAAILLLNTLLPRFGGRRAATNLTVVVTPEPEPPAEPAEVSRRRSWRPAAVPGGRGRRWRWRA